MTKDVVVGSGGATELRGNHVTRNHVTGNHVLGNQVTRNHVTHGASKLPNVQCTLCVMYGIVYLVYNLFTKCLTKVTFMEISLTLNRLTTIRGRLEFEISDL